MAHPDEEIEERYRESMHQLAKGIDMVLNGPYADPTDRKTGFVLLVFPYGDQSGRSNYLSNGADRKHIVTLFKEIIARFEGQAEVTGNA